MSKHKYKFTNKKHSIGGIVSTLMAIIAIALLIIAVMFSFKAAGNGGEEVGTMALLSAVFSVFGLIT